MTAAAPTVENEPKDFRRFIGAPPHRLFAIVDDPAAGLDAVNRLRLEGGLSAEGDIWVLFGEEGIRRLDLSGSLHGLQAEFIRMVQRMASSDVDYLKRLESALRDSHMVLAILVDRHNIDRVASILRSCSAHSLSRVAHWDFVVA